MLHFAVRIEHDAWVSARIRTLAASTLILQQPFATFALGNAESSEVRRKHPASNTELDAPVNENIERSNVLCDPYWMCQWQKNDCDP